MLFRWFTKWSGYIRREPGLFELSLGIPALLALVFAGLVYTSVCDVKRHTLAERYFIAAMHAQKSGETETAKLWLAKQLQLKPGDPAARFRLAILAMTEKKNAKAARMIGELAPENKANYAPAHIFLASELVRSSQASTDPETQRRIRWHLTAALQKRPNDMQARQMLAEYELLHQNLNDAIKHYSILETRDHAINLLLAQLHVAKGERVEAEQAARRGLRHFKTVASQDGTDIESRIEWARLEAFLENYDHAAELLTKIAAYQRVPDSQQDRLRRTLADVYFGWSEALRRKEPEAVDQRLRLLEMSLRFAPEDPRSYQSLTKLQTELPEVQEKVDGMLARLTGQADHASVIHVNLAIEAVRNGNLQLEREHLELALRAAPRLGVAANNLAWNLARSDHSQLDRALQLADQAVEADPDCYEFRATRGRILAFADRNEEAISDLEIAAKRLVNRADISSALSVLYQKVDSEENLRNPLRI